jgi:hypothetical protein
MSFETEGFLSEEAADWMQRNVERHRGLFLHLEVVIRSYYEFLGLSKFDNRNKQHVFTSALFLRSLNSLQALYFLAQRGFAGDVLAGDGDSRDLTIASFLPGRSEMANNPFNGARSFLCFLRFFEN